MFEDALIKTILEYWSADQAHAPADRVVRQPPVFSDVKELLEVAFLVSLEREENRETRVSIVLTSPQEIEDPSHRYRRDIRRFTESLPFTVDSVAKIAPAFDPAFASIAVHRNSSGEGLHCWGVVYYQPTLHRFNETPVVPVGGQCFRPDVFTITVRGSGSLQISRMNSNIGWFVKGAFIPASPTPFTVRSLGGHLMGSLKSTDLWNRYQTTFWNYYRDALELLLLESASRGHGATIVLLPLGQTQVPERLVESKYYFEPPLQLIPLLEELMKYERELVSEIAYKKALFEAIQVLAQLSAVDGALITTNELELVTFGATLKAPKWSKEILMGPDGFGALSGDRFPAQRYGTRHRSAINFAGACKGSTVFVISQDGPTRAFVRSNDETVLCWPDCTQSMLL